MNVTTDSPHINPDNGEWDRQLPNPDLVAQLDPPTAPEHPLPIPDNTIKTLFYWAMDLDIPHGPRLALLTILRHINWEKGDHCTAGIQTLAREAQFSRKTLKAHIKYLVGENLISRFRQIGRTTETRLGTVGVETTPMVGVETTPMVGVAATPETYSSSTNPNNQLGTPDQIVNLQQEGPETKDQDQDHGRTEFPFFSEEEGTGATGARDSAPAPQLPQAVNEWLQNSFPASPTLSLCADLLKHYEKWWWQPHVSDGFYTRTTISTAAKMYTADLKQWQKFRIDLKDKMLRAGCLRPLSTTTASQG